MAQIAPQLDAEQQPHLMQTSDQGMNTAVAVHGIMSLVNTVVPALIYWIWIYGTKKNITGTPSYRVAWRYYWISNLLIWFIPTILWASTMTDSKHVKYFFVNWFKWLYGPQWGAFAATAVWFMNAMKNKDEEMLMDPDTPYHEIVIVVFSFFAVSILNIVLVLIYEDDMNEWYPQNWSQTNDEDLSF